MTEQKISINKSEKNEEMIFISDNEDELLIINNEDKNENNFKVINTIFPKLSSNPFLTLNIDNNHSTDSNNSKVNNRNNNKIFFPLITQGEKDAIRKIFYIIIILQKLKQLFH